MIILDTDILSMFAKADALGLLKHLFGEKIAITPKIRDEILAPIEYGYTFPLKVISLQSILKAIWKKKIRSKQEVRRLFKKIKEMDNLSVSKEVERSIFKE